MLLPAGAHLGHRLTTSAPQDLTAGLGSAPEGKEVFSGPSLFPGLQACQVALGKSFFLLGCGFLGQERPAHPPEPVGSGSGLGGHCGPVSQMGDGSGACLPAPHSCSPGPGPESPSGQALQALRDH